MRVKKTLRMKVHRNLVCRKRKGIFTIQLSYNCFGLCFHRGKEQNREEGEIGARVWGGAEKKKCWE